MTKDERFALDMARFYRAKGFNPLPSSIEPPKKPLRTFAELWQKKAPDDWFSEETWSSDRWRTTNIQVMTGRHWRLLVIDLDGEEAADIWRSWSRDRWMPRTWITHREGGHSKHLWFRLPKDYPTPLPHAFLWRGEKGSHQGVERLCDNRLIVAPPSYHVEHKDSRYRFLDAANSPQKLGSPAPCPDWILRLKPDVEEKPVPKFVPPPLRPNRTIRLDGDHLDRNDVLDNIHDKLGLARSWGVRLTGRVSPTGWAECHAFDRPDARPSAAIHKETGTYTDRGAGGNLSMLDLMVAMGQAHDWKDALERLAERYR